MNKLFNKLAYIFSFVAVLLSAGCKDDIPPEITDMKVSRLFSPTGMSAMVVSQTSIRLTWAAVRDAESYTAEFFESDNLNFSGTPVRTVAGITFDKLPITITGFAGDTDYALRVKAVGKSITESKWVAATLKTGTEQIFFAVNPLEITATGVTLRWPAASVATAIILTPGNITRTLTTSEIAAGVAIITGLQSETPYTAKLMNGTKTRGTATFTTLIDLGGSTPLYPADDLNAKLSAGVDGESFVLFPGNYTVYQGDINITKSITIRGLYPHNKPIVYIRLVLASGITNLTIKDLEMVGTFGSTILAQAISCNPGTYNINNFIVDGCVVRSYNQAFISGGSTPIVRVQQLTINNCIMSNIVNDGGDFIDFRTGFVANLTITKSTFNRVAAFPRDFIRLDNSSGSFPGSTSNVLIEQCTFYQVSNTRRILYVRFVNNASTVKKTIFAGADASYTGYFTNQATTTQPVCDQNNYHNAPSFLSGVTGGKFDISGTHRTLNPGFVNPDAGNFKVTNADLILFGIGDPRWLQ